MNRLASLALAGAFLSATAGLAFAADSTAARMTRALNLVEAQGYGSFSNFKADGRNFTATVNQNDKSFTVVIDPDNDQISPQT